MPTRLPALLFAVAVLSLPTLALAQSQTQTKYDELLASPAHAKTVRSLMLMFLALPHEQDNIMRQLEPLFWTRRPGVSLEEEQLEMETSRLRSELQNLRNMVKRHGLRRLTFIGFSHVGGTSRHLDYYFAGESANGPVMIRTSMVMPDDTPPWYYGVDIYEGWDEVRAAQDGISHPPGKVSLSMSYGPQEEGDEPQPDDPPADEPDDAPGDEPRDPKPKGPPPAPTS